MRKSSLRTALLITSLVIAAFAVGAFRGGTAHADNGISCVQNPITGVVTCFQNGTTPTAPGLPPGCILDQFGDVLCAPFALPLAQPGVLLVPGQPVFVVGQPIIVTTQPFSPFGLPPNCGLTIFGTVVCF